MSESNAQKRKAAALRLKHDLGKYVRWSATASLEGDVDALRERLRADLETTRKTDSGSRSAVEIFDSWRRETTALFPKTAGRDPELVGLEAAIELLRRKLPSLDTLAFAELLELDAASVALSQASAALARRLASEAGPS